MRKVFCERNLKPVFVLLVTLIAATIVWAAVVEGKKKDRAGKRAGAASPDSASRQAPGASRKAGGPGGGGAGSTMNGAFPGGTNKVDAVSVATPGGGIKVIAQPGRGGRWIPSPPVGPGTDVASAPARVRLVAAGPRSALGGRHAFNTVCSLILPTVVSIHATRNRPDGEVDLTRRLGGVRGSPPGQKAYEAVGSGFIVDSRGCVLTNHHVVARSANLLVKVSGRTDTELPATVVAADPVADLALIEVSGAGPFPEARLGDSRSARVGDWVLAFGSPFGLDQTVTQGIISSRRSSLVVDGVSYGDMLQTDAPVNLGSSGGPLVNLKAEVVGVNTAIYGPGAVFSGTGFAIPADRAKKFLARYAHLLDR